MKFTRRLSATLKISTELKSNNEAGHLFVRLMDQDEPFIEFRFTAPELSIPWRNGQDAIVVTGNLGHITALIKWTANHDKSSTQD